MLVVLIVDDLPQGQVGEIPRSRIARPMEAAKMTGMIDWLRAVGMTLPTRLQPHLAWPKFVADQAISRFNLPLVSGARIQPKVEMLRNLQVRSHNVLGSILDLSASVTNWTESLVSSRSGIGGTGFDNMKF